LLGSLGGIVKTLFGLPFVAAVYFLVLYGGKFSLNQTIILTAVLTTISWQLIANQSRPKSKLQFTPHYVVVYPNWPRILIDFKVISGREEWQSISSKFESPAPGKTFGVGIFLLYFLHSNDAQDRRLIFYRNETTFITRIKLSEEITPVSLDNERTLRGISHPDVFLEQSGDGYALGLRVKESWWQSVKSSCPRPYSEKIDSMCGQVDLVLAVIPYTEFAPYWESPDYSPAAIKVTKTFEKNREEGLPKFGWKDTTRKPIPGLGIDPSCTIEHTYAEVTHGDI
jgi:hypothetical protein